MTDPVAPITSTQTGAQETQALHEGFIKRDLIAIDQAANVLTGGLPDETISSRLARDAEKHELVGEIGSKILDVFQKDHGVKAQAGDLARAEQVATVEEDSGYLSGGSIS